MKKLFLLILLAAYTLFTETLAQTPEEIQKCLTMEQDSLLRRKHPLLGSMSDFEQDIAFRISERRLKNRGARTEAEVITIPIVVHVVHNGESVGQGTNISAAQVQSQIDVLNEDFRRKPGTRGFNNSAVGADIEIEFCLATLDPLGRTMPEKGIDRYNGRKSVWTFDEVESNLKPTTIWNPEKYYNIWAVNFSGQAPGFTTLGYAQFPIRSGLPGLSTGGATGASTDGVVILYSAFGSSDKGNFPVLGAGYDKGRTLTHETGHFLGLRHIWGDGVCAEDFCADTPPADGPSNGCQVGRISCGNVNMVQNYMDYSGDACQNIFTQDQKERMRTVIEVSPRRNSLLSSGVCGNLIAGKPIPNFRSDKQLVLRGATVNFVDLSSNFPTQWLWTFEGGEPATSTTRNPSVVYNTPGKYRVSLKVTNNLGDSTRVRDAYIEVSSAGICSDLSNFNGTPTLLKAPIQNITKGYVAGQNNLKTRAKSEFFANNLGYEYLGGASLHFGYVQIADPEATVTITAWNARGFQGGPGAVLESKQVLLSKIQQDIAAGNPTTITFDRNVPVFGRGFHVGIELAYKGDTVALITTKNGESTFNTSFEQDSTGNWSPISISQGLNIAHDITANVGMNPSVQVSSSAIIINQGESVTLNARGGSLFSWGPDNAGLNTTLGPQVVVAPTQTTTYTVTGGGVDLCRTSATVTVVVRGATAVPIDPEDSQLQVYPNPGDGKFRFSITNQDVGRVHIQVYSVVGSQIASFSDMKSGQEFSKELNLSNLPDGMYLAVCTVGDTVIKRKLVISRR
ncbi:PKD domain-containing protein [Rhodocytophaga rosea]|uniref:PKD domain-containing protein n=1 Tax=Rhodocytophaga rosea TaxID=2704465 RepID=A0A6C0GC62_9BACT|nr:M43 family zinc metalloprotease [Rhodocytophaga rosea]QHT65536.1 PKD domain-containing protein [Rhodocytophaga rosea]